MRLNAFRRAIIQQKQFIIKDTEGFLNPQSKKSRTRASFYVNFYHFFFLNQVTLAFHQKLLSIVFYLKHFRSQDI